MYMAARVRLFCVPGPKGDKDGDISYRYLSALHRSGIGVRAISIALGGVDLASLSGRMGLAVDDPWSHWERLAACFVEPITRADYVNMVCCPLGHQYGHTRTAKELGGGLSESEETVTTVGMALCELLTSNVTNIAITDFSTKPTPDELDALRNYDRVICHRLGDVERFREAGVEAFLLPPNDFVATLNLFTKEVPAT
jgi:hypothetical protein